MSRRSRDSPSPEERREAIAEFLTRTGAIGLLREANPLRNQGSRYTDFEEQLDVSSSTLTNRLDEAQELDLMDAELESTKAGTKKVYVLTNTGRTVRQTMKRAGVIRTYDKIQTLEEEFDDAVEEVQDWVNQELFKGPGPQADR